MTCSSFADVWAPYFALNLSTERGKCVATAYGVQSIATQSVYTDFKMVVNKSTEHAQTLLG